MSNISMNLLVDEAVRTQTAVSASYSVHGSAEPSDLIMESIADESLAAFAPITDADVPHAVMTNHNSSASDNTDTAEAEDEEEYLSEDGIASDATDEDSPAAGASCGSDTEPQQIVPDYSRLFSPNGAMVNPTQRHATTASPLVFAASPTTSGMPGGGIWEPETLVMLPSFQLVMREDGLFGRKNKPKAEMYKVCGPFSFSTLVDASGTPFALLVKRVPMPHIVLFRADVHTRFRKCMSTLMDNGFWVSGEPGASRMLQAFLLEQEVNAPTQRATEQPGWFHDNHGGISFAHPGLTLPGAPILVCDDAVCVYQADAMRGSLEGWQSSIGARCAGNWHFVFAISAVLSSVMLRLMNMPGIGFHFFGSSSVGKTTLLLVAASLLPWADKKPVASWRATDNALEELCSRCNDLAMFLDEMGEIEPAALNKAIYMIGNGKGKRRWRSKLSQWTLQYLSSGEISTKMCLDSAGIRQTEGQTVRLLDIPVEVEGGYGAFHHLHNGLSAPELSRYLMEAAGDEHGTVMNTFLQCLLQDTAGARNTVAAYMQNFKSEFVGWPDNVTGRALDYFALAAATGELAISWGILPWQAGHAREGALRIFEVWRDHHRESTRSLADQIMARLEYARLHLGVRFLPFPSGVKSLGDLGTAFGYFRNNAGYTELLLTEDGFSRLFKGFLPLAVKRVLDARGIIRRDGRSYTLKRSLPGSVSTRCYVLNIPKS